MAKVRRRESGPPPADLETLEGLRLDPENRRRRTPRGARMLVEALGQVGAARSIVIDEHNEVIAGNGVVEAAAEAGITKLKVVDAKFGAVAEVPTSDVQDQFWIAIRGPLRSQAVALQRLRDVMREVEGIEVTLGTVQAEAW